MISELYERQARLIEVGEAGQARIAAARFEVSNGPSSEVELSYLRRAGAEAELSEAGERRPFPHQAAFRFAAARAVGEGAWRALHKLRSVVLPVSAS